jgi:hypothetical protein
MPTGKYAYVRYVPIPKNLNRLFRGDKKTQYYVDRLPIPGRGLMSNQLQITSDTKGTGFETVHDTKFNRARDAIMQFLKDNNTSLIDQAQADKFAKFQATNAELDANKGDPGETGDLWSQSQFGKDALAKKKAERERKFNYAADPDSTGSGLGSPGTGSRPASAMGTGKTPGKAVYYDYINSSGQMRKKVWAIYDANDTEVDRGKEGQKYTGTLPTKNEYRNRQEAGTTNHLQGGQGGNNLGGRRPAYYTGPLQGGRFKIHSADGTVIKTVREQPTNLPTENQYKATDRVVPADSDTERERVNRLDQFHSELGQRKQTSTVNDKVDKKIPVQNQDANKVNDAPDSSVQSAANKRPEGPLKDVINKAKDELSSSGKEDYEQYQKNLRKKDNSSTDFTRLLKNAGLLKEFY